MSDQSVVVDMPGAQLLKHWNELTLAEKSSAHDPAKFRMAGWIPANMNGYMGAFSANVAAGSDDNLTQYEKILIGFKIDPNPCIDIYIQKTRDTTEDRDMVHVLRLDANSLELLVPLIGASVGGGGGSAIVSPNGVFRFQIQNDGNAVLYKMVPNVEALWSSGTAQ